jgi:hypothetical protein
MIVMKQSIARRMFLRGIGATVALPLLDGMIPAFTAAAATKPVQRFGIAYVPNGIQMEQWTPAADGAFALTPTLEPLGAVQGSGHGADGSRHQTGDALPGRRHRRSRTRRRHVPHRRPSEEDEGPDIRAGISMDQIAARTIGKDTELASLEICLDANELIGACEAGYSCAYANTLSWRDETTPLPMENRPRAVFERLFGDSEDTSRGARLARIQRQKSILDSLLEEVTRFRKTIGPGDQNKLAQYLEAIRDIERRIQKAEEQSAKELPAMERPSGGIPGTFAEHARLMFDMQLLAYQSDMTRIVTFMLSREVSPRSLSGDWDFRSASRPVASRRQPGLDGQAREAESVTTCSSSRTSSTG